MQTRFCSIFHGASSARGLRCLITGLLTIATMSAQVGGSGAIQGTVTDPADAVIAGASVVATNAGTGIQTSRQTNAAGFFVLSPLQPGEYSVTVKADGFQTTTQQRLVVDALATVGLNLKLQVQTSNQAITV